MTLPIMMTFVTAKSTFTFLSFFALLGLGCGKAASNDVHVTGINDPLPSVTVPVCRQLTSEQMPFVPNEERVVVGNFPWHATIYLERTKPEGIKKASICGATIIHSKLLLTAAHCVFDKVTGSRLDPKRLFVMTGNVYRDYDHYLNFPAMSVHKRAVKDVHVHCQYYGLVGNYASDIALLELQEPFEYSDRLLPACLYPGGYGKHILQPGAYGKIAGFGRTNDSKASDILVTLTAPYRPYDQCRHSLYDERNYPLITIDKFCAGYTNGSAVCDGDTGGGLVFKTNNGWYVEGILSVGLSVDIQDGARTCDPRSYGLYTKVSVYTEWVQNAISLLEQNKSIPSCNFEQ